MPATTATAERGSSVTRTVDRESPPPPKGPRSGRTPQYRTFPWIPTRGCGRRRPACSSPRRRCVLIFGAIVVALVARNLFVAARRPLGWAVAALVMAAAIEPMVSAAEPAHAARVRARLRAHPADRRRRAHRPRRLPGPRRQHRPPQEAIPEAADSIEESDRFGERGQGPRALREGAGRRRRPRKPSSTVAGEAVGSGGAWLVTTILMIFALGWGPAVQQRPR